MENINHKLTDYIGRFSSEFICENCAFPLFVASHPLTGQYCFTSGCENLLPAHFNVDGSTHDEKSQLSRELGLEREAVKIEVSRWDRDFLVSELARARNGLFESWYKTGSASISRLLAVEKLLLTVNQVRPTGIRKSRSELLPLIERITKLNDAESIFEELYLRRRIVVRSENIKSDNDDFINLDFGYMRAFRSDQQASGLVSSETMNRE